MAAPTPYFNPRPREGGDSVRLDELQVVDISIHAPARGATITRETKEEAIAISIHAPARGATAAIMVRLGVESFQSTPPRGGRQLREFVDH